VIALQRKIGTKSRRLRLPVTQFRYYGGWRSWSWCRTNVRLVIDFFLNGMVFLAGRGQGQRTPVGTMSTGSGAGGGGGMRVRSLSTIIKVALWVVVGKESGFQRDALSTAVWVSGMRAGGSATLWTQEIWVLWGRRGGCGLLVILLSGCGERRFRVNRVAGKTVDWLSPARR